ncbi:MAG: type II toxin-antitoxin system VapC family toxin [Verrucomicrobia bacterium]|nr:type II toxin-antitoxin system VapC family toxin [Verrucomicrobiota bacterium]
MNDLQRVLDSSVVIRHFRLGGEISSRLESLTELYLPSVALGELYAGACRSARPDKNLAQIEEFLSCVTVLPSDEAVALHYGKISASLAAKGTPVPQNDMWIAACAMQWNLTLATMDKHFSLIEGLSHEMW